MRIQRVASKWAKTEAILQNDSLAPYIPETRKYDMLSLDEMLGLYETVYIKPDHGTYGSGVMRADRKSVSFTPGQAAKEEKADNADSNRTTLYILRYGTLARAFHTLDELHRAITERIGDRLYLIQKGIDLLHYHKRPFDLRVLVQKNPAHVWETTGLLGRAAAPQKIVTNYHNGGKILTIEEALSEHFTGKDRPDFINRLKDLGVHIGRQLETAYPGLKEIGLDVAVDTHHDIWILEVNTLPSLVVFKMFKDKSIYRKIRRYAAHYGRPGFGSAQAAASGRK